jgi:hypothetical protein
MAIGLAIADKLSASFCGFLIAWARVPGWSVGLIVAFGLALAGGHDPVGFVKTNRSLETLTACRKTKFFYVAPVCNRCEVLKLEVTHRLKTGATLFQQLAKAFNAQVALATLLDPPLVEGGTEERTRHTCSVTCSVFTYS